MCWGIVTWPLVVMRISPAPSSRPKPGGYQQTWVLPDKVILAQTPPPSAGDLRGFFTVSAAGRPGGLPCSTPVSQVSSHSPCAHQTSPPPAGGSRAPCVPVAPTGAAGLVCAVPDHGLPAAGGVCGDHGAAGGEGLQHGEWGPFRVGGE